jgi:uncharacterized protein (TIGR01777 family)
MKIILAGGSGFLGRALTSRLVAGGHDVVVLARNERTVVASGARVLPWDGDGSIAAWAYELDGADAVVNLAGASIGDRRWSAERKELLRSSRINSTRSLSTAIRIAKVKPGTFIQQSAVGFYGPDGGSHELDESSPAGRGFLADVCVAWEGEARTIAAQGPRLVIIRTGLVLAKNGGVLPRLVTPFKLFAGGPMASGRQYMSWIHIDDWVNLTIWALTTSSVEGVVNATAPVPVTNKDFAQALGRALHRPSAVPAPGFALKIILGEMASDTVIGGQRVLPQRALSDGFTFKYQALDAALAAELSTAASSPRTGAR